MTGSNAPPDPLQQLAQAAAGAIAQGSNASDLRLLANQLVTNARAAERAGHLLGEALALYASRGEP